MTEAVIIYKPVHWLQNKSVDWFLYGNGLRHEVKSHISMTSFKKPLLTIFAGWNKILAEQWKGVWL